jgi:Zn-dependent membrane protease YugP/Tfp pilus assembly protein PilF
MDFEDLIERFDEGVFSLLIPLGVLVGAGVVQWASRRFQRIAGQTGSAGAACGLTGEQVARRLLAECRLDQVAVVCGVRRDLYDRAHREIHLTPAIFAGRSLLALAIAAHEVGHAQQYAAMLGICRLRRISWHSGQVLAVLTLLLLLAATVMPLAHVPETVLLLGVVAVVLQAAVTLPLERDASRRARDLARATSLIAAGEEPALGRVWSAAWQTYVAAEARRGIGLLVIAALTVVGTLRLEPIPWGFERPALDSDSLSLGEAGPSVILPLVAARLVVPVVIGALLLERIRAGRRGRPTAAQRAAAHNNAAMALYLRGDFAAALHSLDQTIALAPRDPVAFANRASTRIQLGDWDHALADLNAAITISRGGASGENYRTRGNIWLKKGDYPRAVADFSAAIARAPTDPAALRDRGLAFLFSGELDRALADLDDAIRLDPADAVAFNNRGVTWTKRGDHDRACADLRQAIQLDPRFPNPLKHLAWLQATCPRAEIRQGEQAVANALRALELAGGKPVEWLEVLAAAHAEAGNFAEAVRWQENCLEGKKAEGRDEEAEARLRLYRNRQPYRTPLEATGARH